MHGLVRDRQDHRLGGIEILACTACHDKERALCGVFRGAPDRCVKHPQSGVRKGVVQGDAGVGKDGAHLEEQRTLGGAFGDAARPEADSFDMFVARQDRHDDLCARAGFGDAVARFAAGGRKGLQAAGIDVVAAHVMTCRDQPRGHAAAHRAETDECNGVGGNVGDRGGPGHAGASARNCMNSTTRPSGPCR